MSFHTVIVVGNLGADPVMRYLPNGDPVTSFSVASSRKTKRDGATVDKTLWFRVSVWGKQAESCNTYLKKGSKVLVEGCLNPDPETGSPRVWTNKDGKTGASYEITASTVRFLGGSPDGGNTDEGF